MTALLMGRMSGYVDGGHPQLGVLGHPPRDTAEELGQRAALGTPERENEQLEARATPMRVAYRGLQC
jgi:hypothetical protein